MGAYIASVADIPTGTALKTVLQVASNTQRLKIKELGITFDGTSASATPVLVQLMRQTAAGTPGSNGLAVTPVNLDPAYPAAIATAETVTSGAWTAEPTAGDVIREWRIPPTAGTVIQFPLGDEPIITNAKYVGVVVTAGTSVNATAYLEWQEG